MTELEKVIANLGYPVGMGVAPSPADLARMKSAMTDELWTDDEVEHEMALARTAIIEECARVADGFGYNMDVAKMLAAAIRALKDKP